MHLHSLLLLLVHHSWMHIHGGMHVWGYHARPNTLWGSFTSGSNWGLLRLTWGLLLLLELRVRTLGLTLLVRLLPLLWRHSRRHLRTSH